MSPCVIHQRVQAQVQIPYLADDIQGYGTLHGLVNPSIDVFERVMLHGKLLVHRPVVYCPQVTHVEGNAVRADTACLEVCLVCRHQVGIHIVQWNVPLVAEAGEAVDGSRVCVGRTLFAYLLLNCPTRLREKDRKQWLSVGDRYFATTSSAV